MNRRENGLADSAGSGEDSPVNWKRDVNHDDLISPIDALLVINHLNRQAPAQGAGEAEGEADFAAPISPLAVNVTSRTTDDSVTTTSSGDAGATAATVYAAAVDRIFGQTDWTKATVNRNESVPHSTQVSESDEFFTTLGSGNSRRDRKSR